ncbi:hypothetical protein KUTeg_001515 [Tegillarca granosa]|uniref:Transporter n=1 Tax=Tegillarca granosa TaxID=220873 RepID=A0ABQ9FRP0_TEGGR|nr:hypothetical protein KUTeg_001515 [Tegillarca granosa]
MLDDSKGQYKNGSTDLSNGDVSVQTTDESEERGEWGSKWEFILSCVGLSVGLGNVWRFPYLAYENGGAAFVIAYLILQFLVGKPMYFMELVMGQFSGKGPTAVWEMNPCAKGIGISMALISLVVAIYYNEWTAEGCVEQTTKKLGICNDNVTQWINATCKCATNSTINEYLYNESGINCSTVDTKPVAELGVVKLLALEAQIGDPLDGHILSTQLVYIGYNTGSYNNRDVIELKPTFDASDMGPPLWRLALCLLLSWIVVVCCLIKGVKSSGKVVYFTATFPYVILLILLVWVAAAGQMFFSLSVSFGGIIMFGSYNKFKNNVYGDAMLIAVMDIVTSLIAGFVIFTTFGGMAKKVGVGVEDVARGGYGLAFVAYPEALSTLPPSQLWSVLFFFMLFTLGLDSEFALLETVLTCIQDEFPSLRKYKSYMCVGFGVVLYFLALPCVTPAGDYVVTIMDKYGADFSVLFVAACECFAVMWVYEYNDNVNDQSLYYVNHESKAGFAIALFIYRMVDFKQPMISENVPYPAFGQAIGWILTCVVMSPIPIFFVYKFCKSEGTIMERLKDISAPTEKWGPNDGSTRKLAASQNINETKFGIDNPAQAPPYKF